MKPSRSHLAVRATLVGLTFVGALWAQNPARFVPPGTCSAIPSVTWIVSRQRRQASPPEPRYANESSDRVSMSTTDLIDLDGDGTRDRLVPTPLANDCNNEYHFTIYLVRGACGHAIGTVQGSIDVTSIATAPRSNGLPELTTRVERSEQNDPRIPAQLRTETRTYRFDGRAYREVHRHDRTAVCHHCGIVRCRNERVTP